MTFKITQQQTHIETLVSKIQSDLFNEKALPFPKFPLKDQWSAIVWNEWYTSIEGSNAPDDGNNIISPQHFELLTSVIRESSGVTQYWLIDTEPCVDSNGQFIKRKFSKLDLTWQSFNQYHKYFDLAPMRFYLVDESLTWFIHVDESVLIAGDRQFMNLLVEKMGGYQQVMNDFDDYADEDSSVDTKQWISNIIQRFESKHKNANS